MVCYPIPKKKCGVKIKDALRLIPDLKVIKGGQTNRIDLGDPITLLLYNRLILKDFLNLDFSIPKGFLVPTICNRWAFVDWILQEHPSYVLEVGTGASAILALMFAAMGCKVVATEINKDAFLSAEENVVRNSFQELIVLRYVKDPKHILADLFQSIEQFDAVVCNPPQYDHEYFQNQLRSKKGFLGQESELVGGIEGTEFLRRFLKEGSSYPNFPAIYFQLLNPKIFTKVGEFLTKNDFHFNEKKISFGTRTRSFFRVYGKGSGKFT
ncbi:MAG: RlmF-related methyltransferase [Candidatus Heimdallarchaeota archaeon]